MSANDVNLTKMKSKMVNITYVFCMGYQTQHRFIFARYGINWDCCALYMGNRWIVCLRAGIDNMDNVKWESLVIEINEYLEADDSLDAALRQVVELHLQVGETNENEREAAANALKALLRGRDGTPFRRGQKSAVPASVRVAIDRICGVVEEASLAFFNHDPIMGQILHQHAKSGGGVFESDADYAASVVKRMRTSLSKQYKDGSWDGSVNSLLSASE